MDNIVEELQDIYDQLQVVIDKTRENNTIKALEKLEKVAHEVGKSWSGSWLGYQSQVYYKDFTIPPAGAHFSSEWGFYDNVMHDTRGDWEEYQFDSVIEYIYTKAKIVDKKLAKNATKVLKDLFDEKRDVLLSILETYLLRRKDPFVEALAEKVKSIKIYRASDWIETVRPKSIISRDSLAMSQGLQAPPHISVIAEIFDIRSPIQKCDDLAKHIKTAISHIERQEKEVRRMERVGTNIFIGHGRSLLWKDLKDFIQDRLHLPWDEFNRVPIAGITIDRLINN